MAFDPLTAGLEIGSKLIDRLLPDKAQNDAAKAALLSTEVQGEIQEVLGQLEVDKVEAASNSTFVAGWRPFVGWICGCGIAMDVIVRPLFNFIGAACQHPLNIPALDLSTLIPLLGGMLGFGAMRSWDKAQGTGNGH